jgi:hypothetical protein
LGAAAHPASNATTATLDIHRFILIELLSELRSLSGGRRCCLCLVIDR